jgi:hypothetical protein
LIHAHRLRLALNAAAVIVIGSTVPVGVSQAASPVKLAGALAGSVRDTTGIPQMGAMVHLYNRADRLIDKTLTNSRGEFGFESLFPDFYSVRVTLTSFVPAMKRNISVQPGIRSVLAINMASIISSVELIYSAPNSGTLMSDDWKWVLRGSMGTRPVLRMLPGIDISDPTAKPHSVAAMFSDTRGLVKVSSGEITSPFAASGSQPDLGTTFALATSLFGQNQVQLSGNFGYGTKSDLPAAGFRTTFSRPGLGPDLKLTVQQVGLPFRGSALMGGQQIGNAPALRTMSIVAMERTSIGDGIEIDYGVSLDSVAYFDRLNYLSPFGRLRYTLGDAGTLEFGYSSGAPPVDLLNAGRDTDTLSADVAALSVLPRVSVRDGRAYVQRSQNMEIGYRVRLGSRTYSAAVYHEFVSNAALTMSAPDDLGFSDDLLPELSSNSSVFNIGNYSRRGYTATVTQHFGENYTATVAYGNGGVLTTTGETLANNDPGELRRMITLAQRNWARGSVSGIAPVMGTRFSASYEWSDSQSLTPGHVYLTQRIYPETGLNVRVRQPLPGWGGLPGRLEASAELRNLLAQGYLPISASEGRRLVLAHFPRAVRGGLSFIF